MAVSQNPSLESGLLRKPTEPRGNTSHGLVSCVLGTTEFFGRLEGTAVRTESPMQTDRAMADWADKNAMKKKKMLQFGIDSNILLTLELWKYVAYPVRSLVLCDALSNATAAAMCIHVWFSVMGRVLSCMSVCW